MLIELGKLHGNLEDGCDITKIKSVNKEKNTPITVGEKRKILDRAINMTNITK